VSGSAIRPPPRVHAGAPVTVCGTCRALTSYYTGRAVDRVGASFRRRRAGWLSCS
jgi:hypothetical protein